jgi:N-6 DNA Methylase
VPLEAVYDSRALRASAQRLLPTPSEIALRLGATSRAYALDRASLGTLYALHANTPSVKRKRQRWARLLTTALGTQFEDSDGLFIEHTLLVGMAQIIAHAVVGLAFESIEPAALVSGEQLRERGIHGVVEPEIFDWMVDVPGGTAFIRTLARRLGSFDWAQVEHDVLKVLYESIITVETRKRLGEYYTPDWLAEPVVAAVVREPLSTRVLDPACGSGTFLFHAVRRYLKATDAAHGPADAALAGLTTHVAGRDLHPVSTSLARVTYLLAIGRARLEAAREEVRIPVWLGDSMQWPNDCPEWLEGCHPRDARDDRVDALVGNPPWLAYRHMPALMQEQFKEMSQRRGLWAGSKVATHQDLCALFVARAVQLYLQPGGCFGFLMPNTVVDLAQYEGFRKGDYPDQSEPVYVAFDRAWDLRRVRPHFFPRPCAAVFGRRAERHPIAMTPDVEAWSGKLPADSTSWDAVAPHIERRPLRIEIAGAAHESAYRERFRNGATIVPRVLFMVERAPAEAVEVPRGRARVRSIRSPNEKKPWKQLPALEGVVETEILRSVYVGPSILPYRTLPPVLAVLPLDVRGLLSESRLGRYTGLGQWWTRADAAWREHRSSERLSLREQLDYHGKLASQHPLPPLRIVYAKSGMHLCAAVVTDRRAIIDHTLYWATAATVDEANYLCGILNAGCVTRLVRPLMSYSKDERHIDKHVWRLPIPVFDPTLAHHVKIAARAKRIGERVAALALDASRHPVALRREVRAHLADDRAAQHLDALVEKLLLGRRTSGKLPVERRKSQVRIAQKGVESGYRERFRQGATIVPRVLFMIERVPAGPLGLPEGRALVRSVRSANEKKPWKELAGLEGVMETEFIRSVFVGPSVLPYRTLTPDAAVLPLDGKGLLSEDRRGRYKGLDPWWSRVCHVWLEHRSSKRLSLPERLDYHRELSNQYPIQPVRIVYSKSGMHLCCAVVKDRRAIIDHTLYWATASSPEEASYLCGILNAAVVTELVRPLMSHSKDERHIDKHVWRLPIPVFDAEVALHVQIATLATEVATRVASLPLDPSRHFVALRRQVRAHLAGDDAAQKLEKLVKRLLG